MSESGLRLAFAAIRLRKKGIDAVSRVQRRRLAEMVAHARTHSGIYRDLYGDLPDRVGDVEVLPITDKKMMMQGFNDWSTDPEITLESAQAFAADPERAGEPFMGRYLLSTTSGTSGVRGIFVLDDRSEAVSMAMGIIRARTWYTLRDRVAIIVRGGRQGFVMATGGHFVGAAGAMQLMRTNWLLRRTMRIFPVHAPLPDLVQSLNRYKPAILLGYASVISMLASEQEAGRLRINPVLVQPAGESLRTSEFERIAKAFDAKIGIAYAATECPFIASSCEYLWMHVESDWVILEPVDADYSPTPRGETSHTVLITNLANRIQPVLRYDLGDAVLMRPDSCPCGNPLPAIRVHGRSGDVLTFPRRDSGEVSLAPLTFATLFDRTPGIEQFQIVQTNPTNLRVRLRLAERADPEQVWSAVQAELSHLLGENELTHVTLEQADESPEPSPGGKYRTVIPWG